MIEPHKGDSIISMKKIHIGGLTSYVIEPHSHIKNIVVLLHGYGSDGQDLIGIGDQWKHDMPGTVFISPDAPYPCEISPMGRQWFSLAEYTMPAMEREVVGVWPVLDKYLDDVLAHYTLPDSRMILGGFSQGCMMSLYALPRRNKPCAGILGYSGRLLGENALHDSKNTKTPVHLIHGEADSIVAVDAWDYATKTLEENGYSVTGYTTPGLPHGIDANGITSGADFIKTCLKSD